MEAFVDTGFDLQVKHSIRGVGSFDKWSVQEPTKKTLRYLGGVRPRLNDPQVLDKYDWVKEVDGAVWDVLFAGGYGKIELRNQTTENVLRSNLGDLTWLAYKGQQAGLGYDEWCKAHGVPIINIDDNGE